MDKACTGGFACHFLPGETSEESPAFAMSFAMWTWQNRLFFPSNIEIVLTRPPSLKIS